MDFNSCGARRGARFSAAPLPPPSPPLQLQFHDIFGKLRNLEITKSQGMEGKLSSRCFKAHWEMPSDFNVHLSGDAAGLEPTPAARRCPPPQALGWTGDTTGSRFSAALPQTQSFGWCIETGAALSSWIQVPSSRRHLPRRFLPQRREQSCLLCCFPLPQPFHLRLQHLKGQEKHRFRMRPKLICCVPVRCSSNLSALGCLDLPGAPAPGQHPSTSQNHAALMPPYNGTRFSRHCVLFDLPRWS